MGKQKYEKMLNISNHQRNHRKIHVRMAIITIEGICQNGYYKKSQQMTSAEKDVEKREPTMEDSMEIPQYIKNISAI